MCVWELKYHNSQKDPHIEESTLSMDVLRTITVATGSIYMYHMYICITRQLHVIWFHFCPLPHTQQPFLWFSYLNTQSWKQRATLAMCIVSIVSVRKLYVLVSRFSLHAKALSLFSGRRLVVCSMAMFISFPAKPCSSSFLQSPEFLKCIMHLFSSELLSQYCC